MVENTIEDTGRASIDLTGVSWVTVRGVYEHSKRTGSSVDQLELLSFGEQPLLRQYDIADRNRDRFSTILQLTPASVFSVNGSVAVGKDQYPGSYFGLQQTDNHEYTLGFDVVPGKTVSFGTMYGYARNTALQASRSANPLPANTIVYLNDPTQQFNDPRRDWTDNSADKVHTVNASIDLLKAIPKTDIKLGYDYTRAESVYVYGVPATSVLAAPVQLPAVTNEQQRGTIDGKYYLTPHLALGAAYWYDKYTVNDFALAPLSSLAQPATASPALLMLGYYYRPYTANTVMGRLTYLW